jgi:hypothetical protein
MTVACYFLKMSLTLCVEFVLYQAMFSSLTFFGWRRAYLLFACVVACILPFIVLTQPASLLTQPLVPILLPTNEWHSYVVGRDPIKPFQDYLSWLPVMLEIGVLIRIAVLIARLSSILAFRRTAKFQNSIGKARIYTMQQAAAPCSFGRSIFIHPALFSNHELEQVIAHEVVHVRRYHTADLLLAELICAANWFNPCAWMIRKAIRENLEFAADREVLQMGFPGKPYQYLLLQFANTGPSFIGHYFNISSLQKRIVMINRPRSQRYKLCRFLLLAPALFALVTAFSTQNTGRSAPTQVFMNLAPNADTVPAPALPAGDQTPSPGKHYIISIADDHGESIIIVKKTGGHILRALSLADWKRNHEQYVRLYGELPKAISPLPRSGETVTGTADTIFVKTPLYVVDGSIQPPSFIVGAIEPGTINQISVSKGKDATDKYGERGANGVIEIYTKRAEGTDSTENKFFPKRGWGG